MTVIRRHGLLYRLFRAARRRSFAEFTRLVFYNASLVASGRYRDKSKAFDDSFDRRHGVETAGTEEPQFLAGAAEIRSHAVRYEPVDPDCLRALLAELHLADLRDFVFIDLGSGKGRALLVAAEHPFRSVVGVEFSTELHLVAQRNITRCSNMDRRCGELRSICCDAALFDFPSAPTVCFMFNPFDDDVIRRVLQRIGASLRANPRDFYLVYLNSVHSKVIESVGDWQRIARGGVGGYSYHIWRSQLTPGSPSA